MLQVTIAGVFVIKCNRAAGRGQMNEEEFDSLAAWQPYRTEEALRMEAQMARHAALAAALWGGTSADLERQLSGRHPAIPSGFALADYRELHRSAEKMAAAMGGPQSTWFSRWARSSWVISVGAQRYTAWEARCEIVRRAIKYLENLPGAE
jgi:16S rRNA G1207 methylase RsmC